MTGSYVPGLYRTARVVPYLYTTSPGPIALFGDLFREFALDD